MGRNNSGTGYIRGEWPVLLLIAAVVLPTVCVLWLVNEGIRNQRFLIQQRLADAYHSQLALVRDRLDSEWIAKAAALDTVAPGSRGFRQIVTSGLADSAVILDPTGATVYPARTYAPAQDPTATQPEWIRARYLEDTNDAGAVVAYRAIAQGASDRSIAARAWQAAARSLRQSGRSPAAAELVLKHFSDKAYDRAADLQGRLIAADALLLALHVLKADDPRYLSTARRLRDVLIDYGNPAMSSAQRIFLMKEMRTLKLPLELTELPTLSAEELAATYLEHESKSGMDSVLRPTKQSGVWKLNSPTGRVAALFRTQSVLTQTNYFLARQSLPPDVRVAAAPPGDFNRAAAEIERIPAGEPLPGWQLALLRVGPDPFEQMAGRQMTLYIWIGSLVTCAVVLLGSLAARLMRRSLRVAGMKADLVATVSHELKTPLSSMRLLVDTLLDDEELDPVKTREYLELIAKENTRLSMLIANFLAFSRMERNKYAFEFTVLRVEDIVQAALDAAGERFREPGCELHVELTPGLPAIRADETAVLTALVNLLDNAYKYTPGEKQIQLRAFARNGYVHFEVQDNGIGIAPREMKKIFLKFYQADRRLARTAGGCGLGLSIVRFLVEAQGGAIHVSSEPGKGSTFTVALGAS